MRLRDQRIREVSAKMIETRVELFTKTSDNAFITIHIVVYHQLNLQTPLSLGSERISDEDAETIKNAVYKYQDIGQSIDTRVKDVVRTIAARKELDALFKEKEQLAHDVQASLEQTLSKSGYKVHEVLIPEIIIDEETKKGIANKKNSRRAEAEFEQRRSAGLAIAAEHAGYIQGIRSAMEQDHEHVSVETLTQMLLINQYFDTLKEVSRGKASTVYLPSNISGLQNIQDEVRSAVFQQPVAHASGELDSGSLAQAVRHQVVGNASMAHAQGVALLSETKQRRVYSCGATLQ